MTLKILEPLIVGADNLESNVALESAWSAGTYTVGQQRRVGEALYEVSAASTTEEPSGVAVDWFSVGPDNRYAAFDTQIGLDKYRVVETVTTNDDEIEYTITGLSRISSIAFFGLTASQIEIQATLDTNSDILDLTYELQDNRAYDGSFWSWCFLDKQFETKYANFDLNIPSGTSIFIRISNTGATARVGSVVLGVVEDYGTVTADSTRAGRSRSVRKTDGLYTSLLRRTPSATIGYKVVLTDGDAERFWHKMNAVDGLGTVFSGPDSSPELLTYGFLTASSTVAKGNGISTAIVEVEQL